MIRTFSLWLPAPAGALRLRDLDAALAAALGAAPLRWAVTACEPGRLLVEGAVRL